MQNYNFLFYFITLTSMCLSSILCLCTKKMALNGHRTLHQLVIVVFCVGTNE